MAPGSRRIGLLAVLFVVSALLHACATSAPVPTPPPAAAPPSATAVAPPTWRAGDQWTYGWTAGNASGIKTVAVVEIREIGKVPFYVVRVGELDHLYTMKLEWAGSLRGDRVEARMSPPQPWFDWPLEVGRRWTHRGTYEQQGGTKQFNDTLAVVGAEVVEVPAGRFQTLKVVRETATGDSDEYWYAPEIGFYVRWIGRRGQEQFEEKLQSHREARRLIPPSGPVPQPSGTPSPSTPR